MKYLFQFLIVILIITITSLLSIQYSYKIEEFIGGNRTSIEKTVISSHIELGNNNVTVYKNTNSQYSVFIQYSTGTKIYSDIIFNTGSTSSMDKFHEIQSGGTNCNTSEEYKRKYDLSFDTPFCTNIRGYYHLFAIPEWDLEIYAFDNNNFPMYDESYPNTLTRFQPFIENPFTLSGSVLSSKDGKFMVIQFPPTNTTLSNMDIIEQLPVTLTMMGKEFSKIVNNEEETVRYEPIIPGEDTNENIGVSITPIRDGNSHLIIYSYQSGINARDYGGAEHRINFYDTFL